MHKRYSDALDIYDRLINGENNKYAILAISETGNLYRESKNSEVVDYIEIVLQTKSNNPEVRAVLLEVLSNMYMTNKKYTDIISTSNKLVEDYGNNKHGKNGLMNIFYAYYYQQETEKAFEVLESIDKKYAENMEVLMARSILGLAAGSGIGREYKAENNNETETDYGKDMPTAFELAGNYPNPFNPSTTIEYTIPNSELGDRNSVFVSLIVYDILGREVAALINEPQKPGIYKVEFNSCRLSSGIYFSKLSAGSFTSTKKMIILK